MSLSASPGHAQEHVVVRLEERAYPVTGSSKLEVWDSLREAARREEGQIVVAWTDMSVQHRIWMGSERGGRCRVVDAAVRVQITATFPVWEPPPEAPLPLREQWARYERAIRRHEAGHVRLAREMGRRLRAELESLVAPDCPTLRTWSRWVGERATLRGQVAQDRYDEATDHGRTQGIHWRLDLGASGRARPGASGGVAGGLRM